MSARPGEEEFSLTALCRVLLVRRATIAKIAGACVVLALAISLCMTRRYAAVAEIEINPEDAAALEMPTPSNPEATPDDAVALATQANVLQSDTLALEVTEQLKLEQAEKQHWWSSLAGDGDSSLPLEQSPARRTRALKQFHRNLSVKVVGGTRLLEIQYLDRDPTRAAAVVNTLVSDYLEQYFQTRYNATQQASDWLAKQLADLKGQVESSQHKLVDYQRQTGILGESETNNIVTAKLEDLNKQLSAAEANRIVKQAVWQLAKTRDPELISSMAGSSFVQGVSATANQAELGLLPALRAQEAQLKSEIAETSARVGPAFPKVLQMKSQLAELQSSIQAEIAKIAARAENDYVAAQHAENMERALFEKQKQEANRLNDSAIQYGILKRDVDASRDLYQGLQGKLKEAGVLAGVRSSNIAVIDPARPASKPATPNYGLNLLLGLGMGVLAGAGCALIQDSLDQTIYTPRDVERVAGLRPLGVIPLVRSRRLAEPRTLPERRQQALGVAARADSEVGECFRALRTSLLHSNVDHPPKVIVVSSPLPREGKTTVSVNLARMLAQQGERVLLVDADMRRPSVHVELGIGDTEPGLSSVLASGASEGARFTTQAAGDELYVLPAGPRPPFPAEMLGSRRMSLQMSAWREQFEHVIVDAPPVLSVTDAVVVSRYADAVLLVVRSEATSNEALLRASEMLAQNHAPLLGVVVNAMDFQSPKYAHYFGYSYGAKQIREYREA